MRHKSRHYHIHIENNVPELYASDVILAIAEVLKMCSQKYGNI